MAPAYAPIDGLELGALVARDRTADSAWPKPTFQIDARKDPGPSLQLDATLGRNNHQKLFSVGLKQSF